MGARALDSTYRCELVGRPSGESVTDGTVAVSPLGERIGRPSGSVGGPFEALETHSLERRTGVPLRW